MLFRGDVIGTRTSRSRRRLGGDVLGAAEAGDRTGREPWALGSDN